MSIILRFLLSLPFFLLAVIVHEYAHGLVAYKLGDPTAKHMGRLTLNPLAHIDLIGTIILPLLLLMVRAPFIFGWAKPVPINFLSLKNPKRDMILVSIAGPFSNIALALMLSIIIRTNIFGVNSLGYLFLATAILINLVLAVFNIIPIPPLDGSKIVMGLLPPRYMRAYASIEPYGFIILMGLLYIGLIDKVIWPVIVALSGFLGVQF